jgi:hypothetical protein
MSRVFAIVALNCDLHVIDSRKKKYGLPCAFFRETHKCRRALGADLLFRYRQRVVEIIDRNLRP